MTEESLFHQALDMPAEERTSFLDRACGSDCQMRRRLEILLRANDHPGSFLRGPAICIGGDTEPTCRDEAEHPGGRIGPYKLLQQIGEGGMGTVWMAEQTDPVRRKVAVKIVKLGMDSKQVVARFEQERQALAMMDHPNIAKVFDGGTTAGGRPYFVMELVKGVPITKYCDEAKLTPRQRLELFVPVCQAVQHAHTKGVIHRDLKPSNILVALYDGRPVPKVIDFGVAKATGSRLTERTLWTEFGAIVGTLEYMSPEQAEMNQIDVDTRSDIYALGVILYELLAGNTPFERDRLKQSSILESLRLIREEEPPRPSTRLSTTQELATIAANRNLEPRRLAGLVRGELDWIVMKCLEKDRNRRYETAAGLATDIQRFLNDEPVQAGPPSAGYRVRKFLSRHRRVLAMAAALAVALLLAVGGVAGSAGWVARDRATRRATTEREVDRALEEVRQRHQDGNAAGARASLQRAEALLAAGEAGAERERRVRQWGADLGLATRLEEIRLHQVAEKGKDIDLLSDDSAYREAFRSYGLDVDGLKPDESAARIRDSAIKGQLLAALHDWAWGNIRLGRERPTWERLIAIARLADPDDLWSDRFFKAFLNGNKTILVESARDPKVADLAPATVLLLARALDQLKETGLALEACKRVQQHHPGDAWLNLEIANLLLSKGKRDDAVGFLRAFLAARSRNPLAFCSFAWYLIRAGRIAEGEAALQEALRLQPGCYDATWQLAELRHAQGNLPDAEAFYRQAVEARPSFCFGHWQLGEVRAALGKRDEAEASYREAVRLRQEPEFVRYHVLFGIFLSEGGKLAEAVAVYEHAIRINPNYAEAYCNLGFALKSLGKLPDALKAFRKGDELGRKRGKEWLSPSARWVKETEQQIELDTRLAAILRGEGEVKSCEMLDVAELCGLKRLYCAAVKYFQKALPDEAPAGEEPGNGHRYNAACFAALAASGKGDDAVNLSEKERAELRGRALEWLRADLGVCRKRLDKPDRKARGQLHQRMRHWLSDPDLAGVRGDKAIAQLPEAERSEWQQLWQEVDALRKKTAQSAER
jgi:serine/threonine protein kinase/tetratricopeptide (TPR) repeat protein